MSRNHILLVVFLTTACLTLSLISAYHNDMFSHLEKTTAPVAPPVARPLGSALSALSRHLDNTAAARSSQSYLGTTVSVTILAVGVLIPAYIFALLVLFRSPPAEAAEAVEEKVEPPEKEEEKEMEKEKEKEEEVHHDEDFWNDVLAAKDGRGKAKAVKAKQREEQTNRKRGIKWQLTFK